jgi:hypothetical protein
MAQRFTELTDLHCQFIARQKIFFVASALGDGHINLSPKGMESFAVLTPRRVLWLNVTGSGNETAAHVKRDPRMTIMFCSFEGPPQILRLYGSARAFHPSDAGWDERIGRIGALPGARQVFEVDLDLVQTSCGMAVPRMQFTGEREELNNWAAAKGDGGIRDYWATKNRVSLDGLATGILPE